MCAPYRHWCVFHGRVILTGMPDPTELIAAVLTSWAIAWLMDDLGVPEVPTSLAALLVFATITGQYRRRWTPPPGSARRVEPGS